MHNARLRVRLAVFACLLAAMGVACALGCRTRPKQTDLPKEVLAQRWAEPDVSSETYLALDKSMVDGLAIALSRPGPMPLAPSRPLNLLALSAGGKYGAYTAGVLAGWHANGTRPSEFDVVTGVSSGAILAIYAYLGPQHDATVKRFFTETGRDQLFKFRPLRYLIRYGSLATAQPLKQIIDREINECVMGEIRTAHQQGRRLYLATLNIQSKRVAIWDIGAIACSGRADSTEMIRKILLACCSIPGMVPAVEFDVVVNGCRYIEKHGDGGAATQTYMELACHQAQAVPGSRWLEGSNLYVLAAGKFYPDPGKAQQNLMGRLASSVSASLYALYRAELCKLYAFCLTSGCSYNIIALDQDFAINDPRSMEFSPDVMRGLYDAGYQQAACGVPWRKVPPGGLTGEDEVPRTGTCFITIPKP